LYKIAKWESINPMAFSDFSISGIRYFLSFKT
jgi:hypothetical protein